MYATYMYFNMISYHASLGEFGFLESGSEVLGNLEAFGLGLVEEVLHRHVGTPLDPTYPTSLTSQAVPKQ